MNAILLAAGMGERLQPITNHIPKCLVSINGLPIIERQIQILQDMGIYEIYIVSGYMADKLDYLVKLYNVRIIYNDKYNVYNNLYSLYKVADILGNTLILESDVYIHENSLTMLRSALQNPNSSIYFAIKKYSNQEEWILNVNSEGFLEKMEITRSPTANLLISGISYWSTHDGVIIRQKLTEYITQNSFKNLYWDDIILENNASFTIKVIEISDVYEVDTIEDFKILNDKLT